MARVERVAWQCQATKFTLEAFEVITNDVSNKKFPNLIQLLLPQHVRLQLALVSHCQFKAWFRCWSLVKRSKAVAGSFSDHNARCHKL